VLAGFLDSQVSRHTASNLAEPPIAIHPYQGAALPLQDGMPVRVDTTAGKRLR